MARKRKGQPVHGWLILDKPAGPSSAAVVGRAKRLFDAAKVGHAGTLDPLASGVLPLAFGEATKTVALVMDGRKSYRFTVRWGQATATDDREGAVIAERPERPTEDQIRALLPRFTGRIDQVPPAFSAIKLDGRRAYDLARHGAVPILASRTVEVERLELAACHGPDQAEFLLDCGKGTYVRSLARDLAQALGTIGHVSALRRTRVGRFDESQAIPLDSLEALGHSAAVLERLLPILTALDDIPAVAVTAGEAELIRTGRSIFLGASRDPSFDSLRPSTVVCATSGDAPVALARIDRADEGGELRPLRVFNL
jgi:tRNA pseudouridine55 synthase